MRYRERIKQQQRKAFKEVRKKLEVHLNTRNPTDLQKSKRSKINSGQTLLGMFLQKQREDVFSGNMREETKR